MTSLSNKKHPRWTREQIRSARLIPLPPVLQQRGLALTEREADNFQLCAFPGLIVKDSYWRWPERDCAGTTGGWGASGETAAGSPQGETSGSERIN